MKSMNKYSILLPLLFVLLSGIPAYPQAEIPVRPSNYVTDLAGIVNPDTEAKLNDYLGYFERTTTAQIFVLTINSLEGEPIEDLSIRVAHDIWKIGQADQDNGVLLLVSLRDRRMRLEIGYGLEGVLTDALSRRIEQDMAPYFRQGDYSNGIVSAVWTMTSAIASDAGIKLDSAAVPSAARVAQSRGSRGEESTAIQKIFSVLLVIAGIFLFIKYPRLFVLLLLMSGRGGRGGWGGGGGFSGGGGFGGGGGGGFGGGGASGSW